MTLLLVEGCIGAALYSFQIFFSSDEVFGSKMVNASISKVDAQGVKAGTLGAESS